VPTDNILVLNDYGLTERARTTASGSVKRRYTVEFRAEPIVHNLDPMALGKGPALAIADFLRGRIAAVTATAAPATLRARKSAAKAVAASKAWATKRYAGGKIGAMPPAQSTSLFRDSGRLIRSVVAGATSSGSYVVNVAANRLSPDTLDNGGTSALRHIFDKLRQYVPELGDAEALMDAIPIRRAVQDATRAMFKKVADARTASALELAKQVLELASQVGELGEAIAG
jgi:hypothetical protein